MFSLIALWKIESKMHCSGSENSKDIGISMLLCFQTGYKLIEMFIVILNFLSQKHFGLTDINNLRNSKLCPYFNFEKAQMSQSSTSLKNNRNSLVLKLEEFRGVHDGHLKPKGKNPHSKAIPNIFCMVLYLKSNLHIES